MENLLNCFKKFECKKGECKKTCCALWQISVDRKTLNKYKKVKGDFARRIKEGVDFENSSLCINNGRCAFLNKENLCDIIINLGKEYLGEVCTIHPKFISSLDEYNECGIGLSCEEGARLLITFKDKILPNTPPNPSPLKGFDKELIDFREELLHLAYSPAPFRDRIKKILSFINFSEEEFLLFPLVDALNKMELLDKEWTSYLSNLKRPSLEISEDIEGELTNLLVYFIYRHIINAVDKLDLKSRTLFSLFSTLAIHNIYINSKKVQKDVNLLIDIARGYSAEIEYSEENLFKLLDLFDEKIVKTNN